MPERFPANSIETNGKHASNIDVIAINGGKEYLNPTSKKKLS